MKILALLFVALLPSASKASVYDSLAIYPSTAVHGFTGVVYVAASTATYKAPVITLDGISGNVTAPRFYGDGSNLTGISAGASLTGVRYSTDPVSVALINLSTVTTAFNNVGVSTASTFAALQSTFTYLNSKTVSLSGIRYSTDAVAGSLVDFSTITTALSGKLTSPATFYVVKTSDYLVSPASFTYLSAVPNTITSSLTVTGASNGFGLSISSNIFIVGFSSATKYYGDGSALTGVNATISNTFVSSITVNGDFKSTGVITGNYLVGDGSGITNLPAASGDNLGNHIATTTVTANYGIATSSVVLSAIAAPSGVAGKGVLYYDSTLNVFMVKENNGTAKPIVDPPGNWTCTIRTAQVCATFQSSAYIIPLASVSCIGNEKIMGHSVGLATNTPYATSACTTTGSSTVTIFTPAANIVGQGISGYFIGGASSTAYFKVLSSINCCQ